MGGSACSAGPFPAGARRVGMGEDAFRVSDWLAIGGLVAAGGGLLVSAGVWLFRRLGDIYRWLRGEFTDLLMRRRTVIPWR